MREKNFYKEDLKIEGGVPTKPTKGTKLKK